MGSLIKHPSLVGATQTIISFFIFPTAHLRPVFDTVIFQRGPKILNC